MLIQIRENEITNFMVSTPLFKRQGGYIIYDVANGTEGLILALQLLDTEVELINIVTHPQPGVDIAFYRNDYSYEDCLNADLYAEDIILKLDEFLTPKKDNVVDVRPDKFLFNKEINTKLQYKDNVVYVNFKKG
jgi:hypothetical protein